MAADESNKFPNAVKLIFDNMYINGALFGADSPEDAISISQEFTDLLTAGGFLLRKWSANHPNMLNHLPSG